MCLSVSVSVYSVVVVAAAAVFFHSQKLLIISSLFSAPHMQLNLKMYLLVNGGVAVLSSPSSFLLFCFIT